MKNTLSPEEIRPFRPELLEGRLNPEATNPQSFLDELQPLQIPCPWGDLMKSEGVESVGNFRFIPQVPIALNVGCGLSTHFWHFPRIIQKHIGSDILSPSFFDENYVSMDLTDPGQINLGGARVHFVHSCMVFTRDELGLRWPSPEIKTASTRAICELLFPGGLLGVSGSDDLDWNVIHEMGFRQVTVHGLPADYIYQRPF